MKDELLNTIVGVWEATAASLQRYAAQQEGEEMRILLTKADILWYCAGQIREHLNLAASLKANADQ